MLYVERLFRCAAVDRWEMLQDIIQPASPANCDNFTPFQMICKETANTEKKCSSLCKLIKHKFKQNACQKKKKLCREVRFIKRRSVDSIQSLNSAQAVALGWVHVHTGTKTQAFHMRSTEKGKHICLIYRAIVFQNTSNKEQWGSIYSSSHLDMWGCADPKVN